MAERSVQFRTGYKRGGVTGKGGTTTATPKKKEPGIIKKTIGKIRKKLIPTFGEQHDTATNEGKKKFTSTRFKKKGRGWTGETLGKLEYSTMKKKDAQKAEDFTKRIDKDKGAKRIRKIGDKYEKTTGTKVSKKGQAFAAARKAGKKEFTFEGKKYHTRLKGEEKDKPTIDWKKKKVNIKLPELSGGTAKKIKRAIGAQAGGRIADAARRAQQHGFYSPDMGMRGRGYAKGGLIKGKPKLAVKGW